MQHFTPRARTRPVRLAVPLLVRLAALLVFVVALAGREAAAQGEDPELPDRRQFHLFVLAGQSNMAGRGKVAEQDREPHPRVLVYDKQGKWRPAVAPLHFDKPSVAGVGLGRSFALALAEADPEITVGLIPTAVGGSPIQAWTPGGYHAQTKTHPWDDALRRIKAARADGTLHGILWHQGESDANEGLAGKYEERLHDLVRRFRAELDSPRLPFIAGQMGQFPDRPWDEHRRLVDRAHRRLPDQVEAAAFVSSDGLTHKGDKVHFDARSYRELGRRYAAAYQGLRGGEEPR